jgi:hypothetical protein
MIETWLTITERKLRQGPSKGPKVQGQEPSKGVADPQVKLNAGRDGIYLLLVQGNQPSSGREDVPIFG